MRSSTSNHWNLQSPAASRARCHHWGREASSAWCHHGGPEASRACCHHAGPEGSRAWRHHRGPTASGAWCQYGGLEASPAPYLCWQCSLNVYQSSIGSRTCCQWSNTRWHYLLQFERNLGWIRSVWSEWASACCIWNLTSFNPIRYGTCKPTFWKRTTALQVGESTHIHVKYDLLWLTIASLGLLFTASTAVYVFSFPLQPFVSNCVGQWFVSPYCWWQLRGSGTYRAVWPLTVDTHSALHSQKSSKLSTDHKNIRGWQQLLSAAALCSSSCLACDSFLRI